MPTRKTSKQFKAKSVGTRNASKAVSKAGKKGVSRVKKASPDLEAIIKLANTAPEGFDMAKFILEDEVLKGLNARVEDGLPMSPEEAAELRETHRQRGTELFAKAEQIMSHVRVRQGLLATIELAKTGDINYLRQCESCGNIFFAGRKDQTGCSPDCLKKIRKSRWNKNYAAAKAGQKRGYLKY